MMEKEEERLRSLPLHAPSASLDSRIEELLKSPRTVQEGLLVRPVRVWHCLVACAMCGVLAFLVGAYLSPTQSSTPQVAATEVVYIVHAGQPDYNVFDWTTYPAQLAPVSQQAPPSEVPPSNNQI